MSAGKGDTRRPMDISKEEYDLNFQLAIGKINEEEYKELIRRKNES